MVSNQFQNRDDFLLRHIFNKVDLFVTYIWVILIETCTAGHTIFNIFFNNIIGVAPTRPKILNSFWVTAFTHRICPSI